MWTWNCTTDCHDGHCTVDYYYSYWPLLNGTIPDIFANLSCAVEITEL
jgi:hypothetical protein